MKWGSGMPSWISERVFAKVLASSVPLRSLRIFNIDLELLSLWVFSHSNPTSYVARSPSLCAKIVNVQTKFLVATGNNVTRLIEYSMYDHSLFICRTFLPPHECHIIISCPMSSMCVNNPFRLSLFHFQPEDGFLEGIHRDHHEFRLVFEVCFHYQVFVIRRTTLHHHQCNLHFQCVPFRTTDSGSVVGYRNRSYHVRDWLRQTSSHGALRFILHRILKFPLMFKECGASIRTGGCCATQTTWSYYIIPRSHALLNARGRTLLWNISCSYRINKYGLLSRHQRYDVTSKKDPSRKNCRNPTQFKV